MTPFNLNKDINVLKLTKDQGLIYCPVQNRHYVPVRQLTGMWTSLFRAIRRKLVWYQSVWVVYQLIQMKLKCYRYRSLTVKFGPIPTHNGSNLTLTVKLTVGVSFGALNPSPSPLFQSLSLTISFSLFLTLSL